MGSDTKFKGTEIGEIPEGWVETVLGEVSKPVSQTHDFLGRDKIIFINTGDILAGKFLHKDYSKISTLPGQAKKMIAQNDILFSEIRPINKRYAFVNFDNTGDCVVSTKLMVIRAKANILPEFLYRVLISNNALVEFQHIAESRSGTFPQITFDSIKNYPVVLPPFSEQRTIARILSNLDDKIELNRQMNATLEKIGQAIFKRWFVDFEFPNEQGKPYKSSNGEMTDSELGEIPKGWKVGKLGDFADVNWGDTNTTKRAYTKKGFDAYSASGLDGKMNHYDYDKSGIVLSAIGAYCGQTWYASGKWSCIKNTIRIFSISPEVSTEYIYFFTLGQGFWPKRGSAQPFISQTDTRRIQLIIPKQKITDSFTEKLLIILKKIKENQDEIKILSQIRDALLPKLMSGRIRVKDTEKFTEENTR